MVLGYPILLNAIVEALFSKLTALETCFGSMRSAFLIRYMNTLTLMTQIPRNIALMFIGVIAVSMSGTYALLQPAQNSVESVETSGLMGHLVVSVNDENGNVKAYRQTDNLITNTGITEMNALFFEDIAASASGEASHFAIGTGGETVAAYTGAGAAIVGAITGCARQDAAFSAGTAANGDQIITGTASFSGATCAAASVDEGILNNDLTAGDSLARTIFTPVTVGAADTLNLTWTFTLQN